MQTFCKVYSTAPLGDCNMILKIPTSVFLQTAFYHAGTHILAAKLLSLWLILC